MLLNKIQNFRNWQFCSLLKRKTAFAFFFRFTCILSEFHEQSLASVWINRSRTEKQLQKMQENTARRHIPDCELI